MNLAPITDQSVDRLAASTLIFKRQNLFSKQPVAVVIFVLTPFKEVGNPSRSYIYFSDEGQVFAWGNGKKGQIGCKGLSAGNTSKPLKGMYLDAGSFMIHSS